MSISALKMYFLGSKQARQKKEERPCLLYLMKIFGLPKTKVRQARLGSSTVTEEEKQVSFISKPSQVGLKCYTDGT